MTLRTFGRQLAWWGPIAFALGGAVVNTRVHIHNPDELVIGLSTMAHGVAVGWLLADWLRRGPHTKRDA